MNIDELQEKFNEMYCKAALELHGEFSKVA